jgi:hypothetical protein
MRAHTHTRHGPTQQGRMTPDNATHAGYTTAAAHTPQVRSTHTTTRMHGHENMPAPHTAPRRPARTHTHMMKKESSSRPKKDDSTCRNAKSLPPKNLPKQSNATP